MNILILTLVLILARISFADKNLDYDETESLVSEEHTTDGAYDNVEDADDDGVGRETSDDSYHVPTKKVYVPVFLPDKEKKKMKIISVEKGFFIPGGTQLSGKFKSLKHCMKACALTPSCFGGDFNPWLHKCYQHSNFTACSRQSSHPQYVHFSKVPCTITDAPAGNIALGVSALNGVEIKGIDSLSQCIKKCANAGSGIPPTIVGLAPGAPDAIDALLVPFNLQTCFAINYDFATHKCYFFTNNFALSPAAAPPYADTKLLPIFCHHLTPVTYPAPRSGRPNPNVISISLCPRIVPP